MDECGEEVKVEKRGLVGGRWEYIGMENFGRRE
jgi:hypothetical protein